MASVLREGQEEAAAHDGVPFNGLIPVVERAIMLSC